MTRAYILIETNGGQAYKYVRDVVNDSSGVNKQFYRYEGNGYQELNISVTSELKFTPLVFDILYSIKVNVDTAGILEYNFTFPAPSNEIGILNLRKGSISWANLIEKLDQVSSNVFTVRLINEDIRFVSNGSGASTSIAITAGTSGTDLLAALSSTPSTAVASDNYDNQSGAGFIGTDLNNLLISWAGADQAEISSFAVQMDANADDLGGNYVTIDSPFVPYYVWYDVDNTDFDPGTTWPEINTFTAHFITNTNDIGGKYFVVSTPSTTYKVWYDVGDTDSAPAAGGDTLIEVDVLIGDTLPNVATKTATVLDAYGSGLIFDCSPSTNDFEITNLVGGAADDATIGDLNGGQATFILSKDQDGLDIEAGLLGAGKTGIEVDIAIGDNVAAIAVKSALAITGAGSSTVFATSDSTNNFTVTNLASGDTTNATIGTLDGAPSVFVLTIDQQGTGVTDLIVFPDSTPSHSLRRKNYSNAIDDNTETLIQITKANVATIKVVEESEQGYVP